MGRVRWNKDRRMGFRESFLRVEKRVSRATVIRTRGSVVFYFVTAWAFQRGRESNF